MSTVTKLLFVVISLVVGYSAGVFIATRIKVRKDEEIAKAIVDHLQMENELASLLKYQSIINCVIEKKGMEYAIGYFGQDYMLLNTLKDKTEEQKSVENSLRTLLKQALSPEIKKYKKEHKKVEPQDKVGELKEKIYSDIKNK